MIDKSKQTNVNKKSRPLRVAHHHLEKLEIRDGTDAYWEDVDMQTTMFNNLLTNFQLTTITSLAFYEHVKNYNSFYYWM